MHVVMLEHGRASPDEPWKPPRSQKVANVSNWTRFGSRPATLPQPYRRVLIRWSKITGWHAREVCEEVVPMNTYLNGDQVSTCNSGLVTGFCGFAG